MPNGNPEIKLDLTPIIQDMVARYGYPVAAAFILGFIAAILVIYYFYKHPEQLQKIIANILSLLIKLGFKIQKTYIKLDIESRVNDFIKNLQPLVYGYEPIGVRVKWAEVSAAEESFFDDDNLILIMRDSGVQNKNFVRATMTVVAKTVLPKTRRYLSKSQAESVDLYVGKKLFEQEKPQVLDYFFEEFIDRRTTENDSIAELVEKYHVMDGAGLFFPVFVQELNFLGEKVFYRKNSSEIIKEVNELVDFLKHYALREVGDTTIPLTYQGKYCRCGIVIIGRAENVAGSKTQIYVNHVKTLLSQKVESFYFISPDRAPNIELVDSIVVTLSNLGLEEYRRLQYRALVNTGYESVQMKNHLVVLRSRDIVRYYSADYQKDYIENAPRVELSE